ncbi:hypothetical protein Tco_1131207, partial [Tanacetum coccineum]
NCSPELLHVDGRDTCRDQEGWIKRSERENIQSNLKGGFLGIECGAQSVVATANHKTLFPWNKSIVQSLLLFFSHTHDSAKKESIQFIYNQVYIVTIYRDPELALIANNTFRRITIKRVNLNWLR